MLEPNQILQNRYLISHMLAQGGMGSIYEAKDQRLGNTVALKETFFSDEDLRKAFHREAGMLATLRHPALPKVIDHFSEEDGQFLVMEFIKGEDLYQILKKSNGPIPQSDVLKWTDQLLNVLEYLHTQQPPVIHRDIKPQNLKLNEKGEIILLDFGLAKEDADVTVAAKSVFGYSLNYAPLEQIQGKGTDPRSDLYAVAATMYHLITGTAPADAVSRATAVIEGRPDPLKSASEVNPTVSQEVSSIINQALSLDRNRRPNNANIMRGHIQRATSALDRALTSAATLHNQGQFSGQRPTQPYGQQYGGGGTYATQPPTQQHDKMRFEIPLQEPQKQSSGGYQGQFDSKSTNPYQPISIAEPSKSKAGLIIGIIIAILAVSGLSYWLFLRGNTVDTNASGEIVINGVKATALTENILLDKGSQTDRLWQFTANAGQVTFTLDAIGQGSTVSVEALRDGKDLMLFDGNKPSLTVTSNNGLDERIVGSLTIGTEMRIALRVKTSSPTSLKGFRILIDGTAALTQRTNIDPDKLFDVRDKQTTPSYNSILLGANQRREAYYTFSVGQGELQVDSMLLGNAQLSVEIFSEKGGEALKFYDQQPNVTVTSDGMIEQATNKINFDSPQRIVMRVVNSSPKNTKAYKIKLGGSAQLKDRPASQKLSEGQTAIATLLSARENPQVMTTNQITAIPGKESYFTFEVGPGNFDLTVEFESTGGAAAIQLFDSQSNRIPFSNGSDTFKLGASGQASAGFTLQNHDKVLMRISIKSPETVTSFKLNLEGEG